MRHPDPLVLAAAVLLLAAALIRDLTRRPQPVTQANFEWNIPQPKLPWLGPYPVVPEAPESPPARRELPAVLTVTLPARPHGPPPPPPFGDAPEPPLPLPARAPDPERLAHARLLLGERGRTLAAGPYSLLTDVRDPALLARLDQVAAALEERYRARYALAPVGTAAEAVVLFADDRAYQEFVDGEARLSGLRPSGHVSRGLVALAAGRRPASEVAATLVHELAHLLNRRALGPALPPWLDEGLAEDLAASRFDPAGRLDLGSFGGEMTRNAGMLTYRGGRAALLNAGRVLGASATAPDLERLTALDWETFVRADTTTLTYTRSLLCVRNLLDGKDRNAAVAFRTFLANIAEGGSAEAETLRARLGWSWAQWDARLAAWATRRAEEIAPETG